MAGLSDLIFHKRKWHAYEREAVERMIAELETAVATIARSQEAKIRSFDRLPGSDTVVFMYDENGEIPLIPRHDDLVAAVVTLEGPNSLIVETKVIFRGGILRTLIFEPSYKPLRKGFRWVKTKLVEDLTSKGKPLTEIVSPMLSDLASHYELKEAVRPASSKRVSELAEVVDYLPPDLKKLIKETNGFRIGDYTFHGVDLKQIPTPEGDISIFFEDDRAFDSLCLKDDDETHHYWRYDEINEELVDYGKSLLKAIDRLFAEPYEEIG